MIINETNYVDEAEKVICKLKENKDKRGNPKWITTSKIRNLLAMSSDIYNEIMVKEESLSPEICSRIDYLRVRFVYESGRDNDVKVFVQTSKLIEILKDIKGSKKNFVLFNRYLEALVAFHRYHGGRD